MLKKGKERMMCCLEDRVYVPAYVKDGSGNSIPNPAHTRGNYGVLDEGCWREIVKRTEEEESRK